jgi:hypothetical protein
MSQQSQNISATGMPLQEIQSYPAGANSPMTAGIKMQQQQVSGQMALIGKSGGSRRRHRRRNMLGGTDVLVPPVSSGAVNSGQVSQQYAGLTTLAETAKINSGFDNPNATPAQVAVVAAQQQKLYSGGSKRRILCSSCKKKLTRRRKSTKRLNGNKGKRGVKSRKSRK